MLFKSSAPAFWASMKTARIQPHSMLTSAVSAQRTKRIYSAWATSFSSKTATLLVQLVSIPAAYRSLGPGAFAAYAAVTSVVAILGFFNFGMGGAMVSGFSAGARVRVPETGSRSGNCGRSSSATRCAVPCHRRHRPPGSCVVTSTRALWGSGENGQRSHIALCSVISLRWHAGRYSPVGMRKRSASVSGATYQ
jgi:hypothetical protein